MITAGPTVVGLLAESALAALAGPAGESAYAIAVDNGFVGSQAQWVASLVGPQGPQGIVGPSGPVTTFTVTSVSVGLPGTTPGFVLGGTPPNYTLAVTIPAGQMGQTGPTGPQPWQTPPVAWTASTTYTALPPASTVVYGGASYVCSTGHTSTSTFDASKWTQIAPSAAAVVLPLGQCRLTFTSATTLTLKPFNGNQIYVNGALRTIGPTGWTLSNAGLAANTGYYAYAPPTGTALEASTTAPTQDAATGLMLKSGDASRTFVGWFYTGAGSPGVFTYAPSAPYVISQFNPVQNESFAALNAYVQNSTSIPVDDTIPQITEGSQLMTTSILPRSATSRMRIRFTAWVQTNGTNNLVFALFDGNSNAIQSSIVAPAGAAYAQPVAFEFEYVPGVTNPLTYSIRWGTSGGGEYLNGASTARLLGGSSSATLLVEEIPQ